jgi:hypothetical protein
MNNNPDRFRRSIGFAVAAVLTATGTWETLHVYIDPALTSDPHTTHPAFPASAFELPSAANVGTGIHHALAPRV